MGRPEETDFTLEVRRDAGGVTRVVAAGEVDLFSSPQLRQTVADALGAGPVLLDLSGLSFLDSSGVAALDALVKIADAEGRQLQVVERLQPPVRQILEMTGMLSVLPLVPA